MLERAKHYRDQADHLRKLAEEVEHEDARKALFGLAKSYERLFIRFMDMAADKDKARS